MALSPGKASPINRVGVAGGGAWGTALAQISAKAGRQVILWARESQVVAEVNSARKNSMFLPGVTLNPTIEASSDIESLKGCDVFLLVCPAQNLRSVVAALPSDAPILVCAKGIERESGLLMSEVATQAAPQREIGMLSGPSFAVEVARGMPCAVTLAMQNVAEAGRIALALGSANFRPYVSSDVTGVAVGGAVKNVLAIACGIVEGKGFGESARAALTSRGFAEMARFGIALGAKLETLSGLSGLGDLVLTASSAQSRNFSLGIRLAQGLRPEENGPLAEGAASAAALVARARRVCVDMPIAEAVADIVAGRAGVDQAIELLLSRPLKSEN